LFFAPSSKPLGFDAEDAVATAAGTVGAAGVTLLEDTDFAAVTTAGVVNFS